MDYFINIVKLIVHGKVDYVLFIGKRLVGFVEAKKYSKDVACTMIESKTYAKGVKGVRQIIENTRDSGKSSRGYWWSCYEATEEETQLIKQRL